MKNYFSDYFRIEPSLLEEYGAFNISVMMDFPLFIDPFLLFNSKKAEYQALHKDIKKYLMFLCEKSSSGDLGDGLLETLYMFPEVKQNWFGFSKIGNAGSGLGQKFADALYENLRTTFSNFGKENITQESHLEKLCLIKSGIGKDNISDFTVNLIKEYLLNYTQEFALKYIDASYLKDFAVDKVRFNYNTETWEDDTYRLPMSNGDFVLLTPRDILTKEDTFINSSDMYNKMDVIASSVGNDVLRAKINNYLRVELRDGMKKKERKAVYEKLILKYPMLIDYYIKDKEKSRDEASLVSESKVSFSEEAFIEGVKLFTEKLCYHTDFYDKSLDAYDESYERVLYLKDVIENKDGYKIFYYKGKAIQKESDFQIMFKLVCTGTILDMNKKINNGRASVDFKLASNTQLKRYLEKRIGNYKAMNDSKKSIKVIVYFSEKEYIRVKKVLSDLELENDENIVLIDASSDNKPPASKAS